MKDFSYIQPADPESATEALGQGGWSHTRTRAFAGGQDLYGEIKAGIVAPGALVNLKAYADGPAGEMRWLRDRNVQLGALVRLSELARLKGSGTVETMLREAAETIGSPQIRSRATLAGNLCQRPRCLYYRRPEAICLKKGGDECFAYGGHNKYNAIIGGGPSFIVHPSDLAPALIALDARVLIASPSGASEMALEDFYTLPSEGDVTRENVLGTQDVVTRIDTQIPMGPGTWAATYVKFQEREDFDFALSAVALALHWDEDNSRVIGARLVLGGVAPRPWRTPLAESILLGVERDNRGGFEALARHVSDAALVGAEPLEHNAYKIPLTRGLIRRALQKLLLS